MDVDKSPVKTICATSPNNNSSGHNNDRGNAQTCQGQGIVFIQGGNSATGRRTCGRDNDEIKVDALVS